MRMLVRSALLAALAVIISTGAGVAGHAAVHASTRNTTLVAATDTPHVTLFDSDSPPYAVDATTGGWGFAPSHTSVTQGQQIVFDNPATNFQAHTVTSLAFTRSSNTSNFDTVAIGTFFDSSPGGQADRLKPGTSWTLDTSTLKPGQYEYFCSAHPWALGTFTVLPQPTSSQ